MKNIICGFICFIMLISLSACNEKEKKDPRSTELLEELSNMELPKTF